MIRIVISSVILVILVHSSCIHANSSGQRFRRDLSKLGISLEIKECAQIGHNCGIKRDRADNPTTVAIRPCCEYLFCASLGPFEIKNLAGQAHHSDDKLSTGICTLGLDNNQATKDQGAYEEYIASM